MVAAIGVLCILGGTVAAQEEKPAGSAQRQPETQKQKDIRKLLRITGSGERLTLYAANFQPADIAHDVPLLAAR